MKYLILIIFGFISISSTNGQPASRTEVLIKKLSKEKFEYMNAASIEKLKPMLDERLIYVHSNGMTESKEEMIANLIAEKWSVENVKLIGSPTVRVVKNDVAVLIGKGNYSVQTEGKKLEVDLYYTEVWVHYKKGWLLFSRHASKL